MLVLPGTPAPAARNLAIAVASAAGPSTADSSLVEVALLAPAADDILVLGAPLAGWAGRLDEVADPVFAERMLGDGLAIDPLAETLCAPGVYFAAFSWAIARFDLKTPGREDAATLRPAPTRSVARPGEGFIHALGGPGNLTEVDACTTRLRLKVRNLDQIDEPRLRALGAKGIVRPGGQTLQVVLGPQADQVAAQMRAELNAVSDPCRS